MYYVSSLKQINDVPSEAGEALFLEKLGPSSPAGDRKPFFKAIRKAGSVLEESWGSREKTVGP